MRMRFIVHVLICVVAVSPSSTLRAAPSHSDEAPAKRVETFLKVAQTATKKGDIQNALDTLLEGSRFDPDSDDGTVASYISRSAVEGLVLRVMPSMLGYELLESATHAQSLSSVTYIAKYERNVIVWKVTFYRPRDRWIVLNIKADPGDDAFK